MYSIVYSYIRIVNKAYLNLQTSTTHAKESVARVEKNVSNEIGGLVLPGVSSTHILL